MTQDELQVLIVGAGPTGLALACDLARRGVSFRIIDKAQEYFIGSKGKGLQPRSLEVFDDLGIVEEILALGKFHIPFRTYDGAKVLGELDVHEGRNPTPSTPYASSLVIPQYRVEERLRSLLERSGHRVEMACELTTLEQDSDGVTATVQHDGTAEAVRSRYLVAADGGRSFVRKFLQVPFEGETWKDERMYVGDVRLKGLDREAWHTWSQVPGEWMALCPLPSTDKFQFQAQVAVGDEREPSLELYQQLVHQRTKREDIILTDATWLSLYRVNVRMVSRYRIDKVFLAGDAAHVHSPAGAQGMNTGIQDAYNLGWKLERVLKGAPDALLDTYEEERLPVAAAVLGISSRLYRSITDSEEEGLRRNAVTLQLGITYKAMSLSRQADGGRLKVSAGDRAPDAPGKKADGSPVRLFDCIRGPQFTLIHLASDGSLFPGRLPASVRQIDVIHGENIAVDNPQVFIDSERHVAEAYGRGDGELLLVRPDGYIAWIGLPSEHADLLKYLEQFSFS